MTCEHGSSFAPAKRINIVCRGEGQGIAKHSPGVARSSSPKVHLVALEELARGAGGLGMGVAYEVGPEC